MATVRVPKVHKPNINWLIHLYNAQGDIDTCKHIIDHEIDEQDYILPELLKFKGINQRQSGHLEESSQTMQKVVKACPKNIEYMRHVAISFSLLGKHRTAFNIYHQILKHETRWDVLLSLATCCKYLREYDKGKEFIIKSLRIHKCKESFILLGEFLEECGELESAERTYKAAEQFEQNDPVVSTKLGQIYLSKQNLPKAFEYFGRAVICDFGDTKSVISLSVMLYSNEGYSTAKEKLILASQNHVEIPSVWNNAGLCFLGEGEYQQAIHCLRRAHRISPLSWEIAYNCGLAELIGGYYASAFHFLNTSFALNNKYGRSLMLLGVCLENMNDRVNSRKALSQSAIIGKNDWLVIINCASFAKFDVKSGEGLVELAISLMEKSKTEIRKYSKVDEFINNILN